MIDILKIIIYGIIEGVTEWLPISSTGHLILLENFMKLNVSDEFLEMFRVIIQLGAILAVVVLYFNKLNPFSLKKDNTEKKETWNLWLKVLVASVPAGIIGLLFDNAINNVFYNYIVVSLTLIIYGIIFLIIENKNKTERITDLKDLTLKIALIIGFFQVLALIPGTSRSGATIIGAMILGTSRSVAAEFTFFLGIPIMFGASLLKMLKFGFIYNQTEIITLLIGLLVAFTTALITIKFLINYIKKNDFKIFGWYRIVLGLIVISYFLIF